MKRVLSLFLAALIVLSLGSTTALAANHSFSDVPKTHWAYSYISELAEGNVINGYQDGTFKPDREVNRAEWAKLLVVNGQLRLFDREYAHIATENADLDGMNLEWYTLYMLTADPYFPPRYNNGIDGSEGVSYLPDSPATREDVIVSIVKLMGYATDQVDVSVLDKFSDAGSISADIKIYVALAVKAGMIEGFEDGTLRPQASLTRAQAAKLISGELYFNP